MSVGHGVGNEFVDLRSVLSRVKEVESPFVWNEIGELSIMVYQGGLHYRFQLFLLEINEKVFLTCCHRSDKECGEFDDG